MRCTCSAFSLYAQCEHTLVANSSARRPGHQLGEESGASKPGRPKGSRAQKRTAEDLERPANLVRVLESVRQKAFTDKMYTLVLQCLPGSASDKHLPWLANRTVASVSLYPPESRCPLCDMRALVRASKRARACLCVFVSVCAHMFLYLRLIPWPRLRPCLCLQAGACACFSTAMNTKITSAVSGKLCRG